MRYIVQKPLQNLIYLRSKFPRGTNYYCPNFCGLPFLFSFLCCIRKMDILPVYKNYAQQHTNQQFYVTCNISNKGIKKAIVFPLPVTASAATSFPFNNNGIVAACRIITKDSVSIVYKLYLFLVKSIIHAYLSMKEMLHFFCKLHANTSFYFNILPAQESCKEILIRLQFSVQARLMVLLILSNFVFS